MNQKIEKIIIGAIIAIIIIAGAVVVKIWGFNKETRFEQVQRIDITIEQEVDEKKIKEIANEVLGMGNRVQVVEMYKDIVTIKAKNISEEQKNTIVTKVKENYEFEQTAEKTTIKTVPGTRFRDMFKQYVVPFVVVTLLVAAYMMIRYNKKGILKVLVKSLSIPVIAELILLSWGAIVRLPVGRFMPVFVLLVYVASVWFTMREIEK